jgi:2-polyprenyl-6-methoxyphenol hydroxylase-like FAD-dependent oxidoreductase
LHRAVTDDGTVMEHFDVVVVGAGPVGLGLSFELGLQGLTVLVLEQSSGQQETRSMGLHPRTVEHLDRRGLLDDIREAQAEFHELKTFRGGFGGIFVLGRSAAPAAQSIGLGVTRELIKQVYLRHLDGLPVRLRYESEFIGFTETDDEVVVCIDSGQGHHHVSAQFLVGCDGGSSRVRKQAGIAFSGTEGTVVARLGQAVAETTPALSAGWLRTETGWLAALPFDRILTVEWSQRDREGSAMTSAELHASIERVLGRAVSLGETGFVTRFTDAARQAEEYRRGRVLLAGDAAHIHFPVGGQGVNLGLQDAMNLGWKLAATCHGSAPDHLLASYHSERHPVGVAVLDNTPGAGGAHATRAGGRRTARTVHRVAA